MTFGEAWNPAHRRLFLSAEGACVRNVEDMKRLFKKKDRKQWMLRTPWGLVRREFVLAQFAGKSYLVNCTTGSLFHPTTGEHMASTTLWIDFDAPVEAGKRKARDRPTWKLKEGLFAKRVASEKGAEKRAG